MAYEINYNDKRFTEVNSQKNAALNESNKTYDQMIKDSDKYYQGQIDAVEQWGETQKQNQQAQTDFAIEKIEQQKDQAHKDYLKEQSAAYVDWQKQSNDYGSNAEKMADMGLAHTGYSESSKVSMYNTYQNRVATAREAYSRAVLNYDNAIKDAQLQNNSILAEIAYNTLQQSLELSLQGFQYKNQLVLEKANKKAEIDDRYYNRYQNVLSQINTENAMAEQIRQYNESLAEQKRQYNESLAFQKEQFAWQKKNSSVSSGGGGGGGAKNTKSNAGSGAAAGAKLAASAGKAAVNAKTSTTMASKRKTTALTTAKSVGSHLEAKELLMKYNINNPSTPLLSSTQWQKGKKMGDLSSEFVYDTYKEYLRSYCQWAIGEYM